MNSKFASLLKRNYVKNFSFLTISNLTLQFFGIITSVKIASSINPNDYGILNLFSVYSTVFGVISAFGIRQVIVRMVAGNPDEIIDIFRAAIILRIFTTMISILTLLLYEYLFNSINISFYVTFLIINLIFNALWDMFEAVTFGKQNMGTSSILTFIYGLVFVITILIMPKEKITVFSMIAIPSTIQIFKSLSFAFLWRNLITGFFSKIKFPIRKIKTILHDSLPYLWVSILTILTNQIPILFLNQNSNLSEVGYFGLAFKLVNPLNMFLSMGMAVLLPNLTVTFVNEYGKFESRIKKGLVLLILVGSLCAGFVSLFRNDIVDFLYGARYKTASNIIAFQIWYSFLYAVFSYLGTIMGSMNKQNIISKTSTVYVVIAIPILWISSYYGAEIFSLGYLISACIGFIYLWHNFQKIVINKIPGGYVISIIFFILLEFFVFNYVLLNLPVYLKLIIALTVLYLLYNILYKYADKLRII